MEWIKCSEKMPENRQRVIATDIEYVGEYYFMGDHFETDEGYYINATHWMPLPTPPSESEDLIQSIIDDGWKKMSKTVCGNTQHKE